VLAFSTFYKTYFTLLFKTTGYERILRFMRPLMVSPAHLNFSPNTFNKLPGAKPRHFAFFGENSTEAL